MGNKLKLTTIALLFTLIFIGIPSYLYFGSETTKEQAVAKASELLKRKCNPLADCRLGSYKPDSVKSIHKGYEVIWGTEKTNNFYRVLVTNRGKTFWIDPD